ncbi:Rho1 guanine nucleotide exchange factor 2 [Schizosaccharomyces pombe 972h-] [Rhizoctonia solani]|uniref:Rho1 guanine nucleotide exchange factor 2 [Schizosaccharomyces pombe 972h-] n=1 Tax=Rhizoctonia solani TaxID=456999 RepID=A0A0K6GC87_9AGAM|nr:Rho1 guanine nucleotide exchange factor 2 [Schizosaccharomyces pombe 972h-] [Rhizoctonia solani]
MNPGMSIPRPPYADDSSPGLPYNHYPETRASVFSSLAAPTSTGIAFPQPIISGHVISPPLTYEGSLSPPPHGYQSFLSAAHAARPPKRPVPPIPAHTAPPTGWPHLGPVSHTKYDRDALSEGGIPRSRSMKINLPDPKTLQLLRPEEVASGAGLHKFHENQLHGDDRYWHRIIPESVREKLGKKEQARQQEIFEIISSEQLYVCDLEVWLKAYRDPLPTAGVIASQALESLIQDIFANIEEIKIHHEVLLRALFETQKKNFHEVYSIMDDLLDAVSNEEFQNAYVRYISNMDTALARHGREKEANPAYAEFISSEAATARHPYVQRMGFTSFIQRAGRRLGQLKLLVEQLSKSTDVFHPDQQGSMEMVLDMLHRTVMKGQADGEASAEEIALRSFRESLENHPWDFADLGLAYAHRAVKFEGRLTQVYPSANFTLYVVLLDNYLVFTQLTGPNNKRRLIHKPIPLELLDAELETTPPKTRTRVSSMLSRADSTELIRFAIKRDGEVVLQVGAQTQGLAEKWIRHIQEAVLLRKLDVDDNKADFSPLSSTSHLLRNQVRLLTACPFVFQGNHYMAGATTTGVFFGQKNDSTARSIEALPAAGVSQIFYVSPIGLMIVHGGSLSVLPVDNLLGPNRRSSFLEDKGIPLSNPSDGYVSGVTGGMVGSDCMVAFISRNLLGLRKKLNILIYDAPSSLLRRLDDPITISDSITDISLVSGMLFLLGKTCQVVVDPVNRFISAIETEPGKILLVYESHGCFVDTSGQPIPSHRMLDWATIPTAATYCKNYIVLFSDQKIEIRRSTDGYPLQIIGSRNLNLVHPVLTYSSNEAALVTTNGEEGTQRQLLGELLPTSKIEWDPTIA